MRTGSLAAMLAALVGTAAAVPLVAWLAFVVWGVLARTTDYSMTSLVLRRYEAGRRRSDVPVAVAASPWHLLRGVLSTGLSLLLPLAVAAMVAVVTAVGVTELGAGPIDLDHPLPLATGTLAGVLLGWWGPGGVSLRRGSRTAVRNLVPRGPLTTALVAVLVAGGLGLLVWSVLGAGQVSWWPTTGEWSGWLDQLSELLQLPMAPLPR